MEYSNVLFLVPIARGQAEVRGCIGPAEPQKKLAFLDRVQELAARHNIGFVAEHCLAPESGTRTIPANIDPWTLVSKVIADANAIYPPQS